MMKIYALALVAVLGAACSSTNTNVPSRGRQSDNTAERIRDRTNTNASPGANDNSPINGIEVDRVRNRTNTNVNDPK
ncbi:MAG: hypothetical protein ACAI38_06160 [Myxococcota bacterium]